MPHITKRVLLVVRTGTRSGYVVKNKNATQHRKTVFSLIEVLSPHIRKTITGLSCLEDLEIWRNTVGALAGFEKLANGIRRAISSELRLFVLLDISFRGSPVFQICWMLSGRLTTNTALVSQTSQPVVPSHR
jgi:hypothetical protein